MSDFDKNYPNVRAPSGKPGWPTGVRSISADGLDYIGIDDVGRIYWDGKPLAYQVIRLTGTQNVVAIIGMLAVVSLAAVNWLRFFGFGAS